MKTYRLLVCCHDAQSANVTIAYLFFYKSNFSEISIYAKGPALEIYLKSPYSEYLRNIDTISFTKKDTLLCGTSGINSSFEMGFIINARKNLISKIIVLIDDTKNFLLRFKYNNEVLKEEFSPDEIWVNSKDFVCEIEYLNKKLKYKENLYENYLIKQLEINKPKKSHPFIEKYSNKYIVILTEYLYDFYHLKFGFTEYEMVEHILKNIDIINQKIPIFIKLHPAEHKNKFNILLRKYSHLNIVCEECNTRDLIYFSTLVLGINSSVFLECKLYKILTYSVQIGSNKTMNTKILKPSEIIYTESKLQNILKKIYY